MRRSLRKIDTTEVGRYTEGAELFTVQSLEDARQRLLQAGLDPANFCFFTWMREGVRYYRVWEDKKLKEGIVQTVPFGQIAARLKRADAEKLYTVANRYSGRRVTFSHAEAGLLVQDAQTGVAKVAVSVPLVGGCLIFEEHAWTTHQAAHFINVILVRGQSADVAYEEADAMQVLQS